uniref:Transposase n=1 Tax=Romanomermis culicivorax TaxID=13658 RepID=A0A915I8K0_ROMCU
MNKRKSDTATYKLEIVNVAKKSTNRGAASKYGIDEKIDKKIKLIWLKGCFIYKSSS